MENETGEVDDGEKKTRKQKKDKRYEHRDQQKRKDYEQFL